MSIATVACRAHVGMHAPLVQVEVSVGRGLPFLSIVGLAATVVKESKERVRAALLHSGFEFPAGRITVNLSPVDLPKRGGRFDLPIALGILFATGQIDCPAHGPRHPGTSEFYGELGLGGELRPIPGLLAAVACASRAGNEVFIPKANATEVSVLLRGSSTVVARAADSLRAVCAHLEGTSVLQRLTTAQVSDAKPLESFELDLSDVRGQIQAKRALSVAAAGQHSLLMLGPPGAGKSMLARRLPGLLPPMTEAESLEAAVIASASGVDFNASTFGRRPVRAPHHTASAAALVGGGSRARPGEISLAHHGVLFLDELLEFDRYALEALREPLESGVIHIARSTLHARYPAQFQLIAAMNPCPCGRLGDASGSCICTPAEIARYRARISAPLLDRLDIHVEVPRVAPTDFEGEGARGPSSAAAAAQVMRARERQLARQGVCNARLPEGQVEQWCVPDPAGRSVLERAMRQFGFSARARQRILKLARTIADMGGEAVVSASHVSEALSYRMLDRRSL